MVDLSTTYIDRFPVKASEFYKGTSKIEEFLLEICESNLVTNTTFDKNSVLARSVNRLIFSFTHWLRL
mgnify:CR=1 FL=1